MQTLRFASPAVAARYPLAISGGASWVWDAAGDVPGWSTTIALPDQPNDNIVVPSFAQASAPGVDFTVTLRVQDAAWTLRPTARSACEVAAGDPRATTHIDYFHCRARLTAPTLTVTVATEAQPDEYLLTVGGREFHRPVAAGTATAARLVVTAVSQKTAPRSIRHRICSPASLVMVLRYHGADVSLATATRDCLHAPSQMYGVWPLAIRTAADAGLIAAVECFTDLDAAAPLLAAGFPIIASIRFAAGALSGAPLASTEGHLVVVTGMDADWVYVNDPAATDASGVPRQYPREQFAAAWLSDRGVGYVVSPP